MIFYCLVSKLPELRVDEKKDTSKAIQPLCFVPVVLPVLNPTTIRAAATREAFGNAKHQAFGISKKIRQPVHPARNLADCQPLAKIIGKVAAIATQHVIVFSRIFLAQVSENIHDQVLRQLRVPQKDRLPKLVLMMIPWKVPSHATVSIICISIGPFHTVDLHACVEGTTKPPF